MSFWSALIPVGVSLVSSLLGGKKKAPKVETYKPQNTQDQKISDNDYLTQIQRSKDLAQFKLGLDQDMSKFNRGLREEESQADFGRKQKLVDQDYGWQRNINLDTQGAQTDRLQRELDTRKFQQQKDIDQQNTINLRAINIASRRLGGLGR